MAISVTVCGDVSELGRATLARLHGPVVAISGGSTFEALFPHWTGPSLAGISFVPVDERKVELDAPGSNWKVAIQGLLRPNCLADQADHWTPSAVHLESLVRRLVKTPLGQIPSIPQIWLGMGDDGHTASLFPQGPELLDTTSLALETVAPKAPHPRVTLGLAALRACPDLCVVVTGQPKGSVLRRVLDGDRTLPLTLALENRDATLFLDAACARAAGI